jgi:sec-independent protein translocase protein TatA
MGGLSIWHILIIVMIALLLFGGRGKLSDVMGDFAKGINSFRKGLNAHDDASLQSASQEYPQGVSAAQADAAADQSGKG